MNILYLKRLGGVSKHLLRSSNVDFKKNVCVYVDFNLHSLK
jgi:hypothetical protein